MWSNLISLFFLFLVPTPFPVSWAFTTAFCLQQWTQLSHCWLVSSLLSLTQLFCSVPIFLMWFLFLFFFLFYFFFFLPWPEAAACFWCNWTDYKKIRTFTMTGKGAVSACSALKMACTFQTLSFCVLALMLTRAVIAGIRCFPGFCYCYEIATIKLSFDIFCNSELCLIFFLEN